MDSSSDAMICTFACTKGSGKGRIISPRPSPSGSRSLENQAARDVEVDDAHSLFLPDFENEESSNDLFQLVDPINGDKDIRRKPSSLRFANQRMVARAQERLAEFKSDPREAERAHRLMLAL